MGREPQLPQPKTFTDGEGWLERFIGKATVKPSKCCTKCRRGTVTHSGGCNDTHCTCHTTAKKPCPACGRMYTPDDLAFHWQVKHPEEAPE